MHAYDRKRLAEILDRIAGDARVTSARLLAETVDDGEGAECVSRIEERLDQIEALCLWTTNG